jgi:hypothetical protein
MIHPKIIKLALRVFGAACAGVGAAWSVLVSEW